MPNGPVDPATLEGDDLVRWYQRSPWDVEQERQAARRQQYYDFFGVSPTGSDGGTPEESAPEVPPGPMGGENASRPALPTPSFGMTGYGPGLLGDLSWLTSPPSQNDGPTSDGGPEPHVEPDGTPNPRTIPTSNSSVVMAIARRSAPRPPPINTRTTPTATAQLPRPQPNAPPARPQPSPPMVTYGGLRAYLPSDQEMAELRRQQAAQQARTNKLDIENSWFAVPALAPPLAVLALEGGAALLARSALPKIPKPPLDFVEREPFLRVGDNWATRAGRRAHAWFDDLVSQKEGWEYEPKVRGQPKVKPDAGTPQRNPANPDKRYYLELKPNTPTGRAAAARAVKRYEQATGQKVRAVYYDPKDFM